MMRAWMSVALLAGSWLFGVAYYQPANPLLWCVLLAAGVALLVGQVNCLPGRREMLIGLALLALPVWWMPWPDRAAPLLIALGLALAWLPFPGGYVRRLANAAVGAGIILTVQALAFAGYTAVTARSHELPTPLTALLEGLIKALGIDASWTGDNVVMHSMRQVHPLGATWDLLLDPASVAFLVGGLALVALTVRQGPPAGRRFSAWLRVARNLLLVTLLWLPLRAALLVAVYLQRDLRFNTTGIPHLMNHFMSPWVQIPMLGGLVLLAWRFVHLHAAGEANSLNSVRTVQKGGTGAKPVLGRSTGETPVAPGLIPSWKPLGLSVGLTLLAAFVLVFAVAWEPLGNPKRGRVMFVERHSTSEYTTVPYDTKQYGEKASYTYTLAYEYCARFFQMSQLLENEPISADRLSGCDVLVIKIPTARFLPEEVQAIVQFVQRGGGLLMIGEHTNLQGCGTYLNDIARNFGFVFRNDLLFGTEVAYDDAYRRPPLAHPMVQHVPEMEFVVSCSVDPGLSFGRAALKSTNLWSLPPDYYISNYFPFPYHQPTMRYGAFIQLWGTHYGEGRVAAFTDSTLFSSFCTFQPGKMELLLGIFQWLNHDGGWAESSLMLGFFGVLFAGSGLWMMRRGGVGWLLLLTAALCGYAVGGMAVEHVHRVTLPPCQPKPLPANGSGPHWVDVAIDRTVSAVPLCRGAFPEGDGAGYGLLEQWIPRLGYHTVRCEGEEAFAHDVLVVICPNRSVPTEYRERLERYVAEGGKLLVLDSPENSGSTANSLLWPFGLSLRPEGRWRGNLVLAAGGEQVPVERAGELAGGEVVARVGDHPVAIRTRYRKGTVMAVGFASLLDDAGMGTNWNIPPDDATRLRYELLFALLRGLAEDKPIIVEKPPASTSPAGTVRPQTDSLPGKAR
jgi:hypothetical protein